MKNGGQSFQLSWTTTIHDRIATVAAHAHTRVLNNPARHNTHAVYHNGGHDRSGSCDLQRASTSASSPGTFGAKLLMTQSQGKPSQPARKPVSQPEGPTSIRNHCRKCKRSSQQEHAAYRPFSRLHPTAAAEWAKPREDPPRHIA